MSEDPRINAIEERLEKATPGALGLLASRRGQRGLDFALADADLIANAPSDLRYLVDERERQKAGWLEQMETTHRVRVERDEAEAETERLRGETAKERALIQDDLHDLLVALGLFSGAQPHSPHVVMRGAIVEAARLGNRVKDLEAVIEGQMPERDAVRRERDRLSDRVKELEGRVALAAARGAEDADAHAAEVEEALRALTEAADAFRTEMEHNFPEHTTDPRALAAPLWKGFDNLRKAVVIARELLEEKP